MNAEDIKAIVEAHRANPRQVTTMAVAFCMQRYKAQIGETLRAADLMASLGVSDSMARRAVRAAREMVAPTAPDPAPPDAPETPENAPVSPLQNRNFTVPAEPHRSGTSPFRRPEPHRSADRNGEVPLYKDRDLDRVRDPDTSTADASILPSGEIDPMDDIGRACAVLRANLQTEALAGVLSRNAHLDRVRALASDGWRLESAARKFLDPFEVRGEIRESRNTDSQLKYLLKVASGLARPFEPEPTVPMRAAGEGKPPRRGHVDVNAIPLHGD